MFMKKLIVFPIILLCAVMASAQKVKVAADPGVDISKYKTYAWDKGMPAANPMISQIIIDAIDRAMAAKGLTRVTFDADIMVVARTSFNSDLFVSSPGHWNPLGNLTSGSADVGQSSLVSKASLMVDIADARTRNSVWQGAASATVQNNISGDPAKNARNSAKNIDKAVEKMFKQFPRPK